MKTILPIVLISAVFSTGLMSAAPRPVFQLRGSRSSAQSSSPSGIIESHGEFSMFAAALKASGLEKSLQKGTYTILAPTNAAFARIPGSTMDMLMYEGNKDILRRMVEYHIIPGKVTASQLRSQKAVRALIMTRSLGSIRGTWDIEGAKVITSDIQSDGALIHAIDRVLLPEVPILQD